MIYSRLYRQPNAQLVWRPNNTVREILRKAEATLAQAGVASPRYDATQIAAHLLQVDPLSLGLMTSADFQPEQLARFHADFDNLIARRAARQPLQHILGLAWFGELELSVGPGVFIPRPETELLAQFTVDFLLTQPMPVTVIDLCTGSGAIAGYIAHELHKADVPAQVIAVELFPEAASYARRNLANLPVLLLEGDATDLSLLAAHAGQYIGHCDAVISNPPYVPETLDLQPEVYADPATAVFSGTTGMDLINQLVPVASQLLRSGGLVAIEHDDTTQTEVMAQFDNHGLKHVHGHNDLAGRPRFVSGIKP